MNLFLTEDGVLKLGYYGLTTLSWDYSLKKKECDRRHSFAPDIFKGWHEMENDVCSLGIALIEMMGIRPSYRYKYNRLSTMNDGFEPPFKADDIQSSQLADFLKKCFEERVSERWCVSDLMNVSVMGWRMMSSIHL